MSEASVRARPARGPRSGAAGRRLTDHPGTGSVLAGGFLVLYAAFSLLRHVTNRSLGFDLGLNYQLVQSYARFETPHADIVGAHVNLLGDHFSPAMALLVPVYWLWQDPRALLVAQAALVALSIVPVHRVARRHLTGGVSAAVAAGYALGWPLQSMVGFDVHEVMFAVPLIAFALDAMDRRADRTLLATCVGLVLVKEDMGLLVLMLGLVRVLLEGRRGSAAGRRAGLTVMAVGVAGYALAMVVISSLSAKGGVTHWTYDALGPDVPSALGSLVLHPLDAARLFLWSPPVKTAALVALVAPVLLLCFRSPYALALLPLLAERFFSSTYQLWGPYYHYSATAWPIVVVAAVDGVRRLHGTRGPRILASAVLGSALLGTALLPAVFTMNGLLTGRAWQHDATYQHRRALLAQIPAGACVEADDSLVTQLLTRNRVSEPGHLGRTPDFVALDDARRVSGLSSPSPRTVRARVLADGYTLVAREGTLTLYRSPAYAGPTAACRP